MKDAAVAVSASLPASAIDLAAYESLFSLARSFALRLGVNSEDAEDCGREFGLRVLLQKRKAEEEVIFRPDLSEAERRLWERRCAANFALDFRRSLHRRLRHELSESSFASERDSQETEWGTTPCSSLQNYRDPHLPPMEVLLLRRWLWEQVMEAVDELPTEAYSLFVLYLFADPKNENEATHISDSSDTTSTTEDDVSASLVFSPGIAGTSPPSGKSPNAIRQSLHRSRRRVRAALLRRGVTGA